MSAPTENVPVPIAGPSMQAIVPHEDALNPSAWDGLPSPSRTFGHLVQRGLRKIAGQGRGLFARLGVLASHRAWLAWVCGMGVFVLAGLTLLALWATLTGIVWPTLAWIVSGLDPAQALPGWARGLLGLVMVVLGALLVRLCVSLLVDYPARFWIALSLLARPDDEVPAAQRTQARDWLSGAGIFRGVAAVILLAALIGVGMNARTLVHQAQQAMAHAAVVTLQDTPASSDATPATPPPSLALTIQSTIGQVENGQAQTFDLDGMRATSADAIDPRRDDWQRLTDAQRNDVLKNQTTLAMWTFLPALDAHVSNLVKDADAQRTDAMARGDTGEADEVVTTTRAKLTHLNDALWLLTQQDFAAVNLGAIMAKLTTTGYWSEFDYLAGLPVAHGTGLHLPESYACALVMSVPAPYAPTRMSVPAQKARADVVQRYNSLNDTMKHCDDSWDAFRPLGHTLVH